MNPHSTTRWLVAAFAAVVLAFLGATVYSELRASQIDEAAGEIADDLAPGIARLADGRGELRELRLLLKGPSPRRDEVQQLWARTRAALLAAPTHVDNTSAATLRHGVAILDAAIASLYVPWDPHAPAFQEALARTVMPPLEQTGSAALALLDLAAGRARRLAFQITDARDSAGHTIAFLDGLSVCLALIAAVLLWRAIRHYTIALEAHEAQLRERADELERFADRVAHDVASPLSAVQLSLEMVNRTATDVQRRAVERGLSGLRRSGELIRALLAFAKSGATPAPGVSCDPDEVIRGVVDELQPALAEARVKLDVELHTRARTGCAAPILSTILSNLVRNAVKYMGEATTRRVFIRVAVTGERLRFEVADTGPGLQNGMQTIVFEPYVRASGLTQTGIGLGLATVKRMVEAHGGDVGVWSPQGRGATFWFDLPRSLG